MPRRSDLACACSCGANAVLSIALLAQPPGERLHLKKPKFIKLLGRPLDERMLHAVCQPCPPLVVVAWNSPR